MLTQQVHRLFMKFTDENNRGADYEMVVDCVGSDS